MTSWHTTDLMSNLVDEQIDVACLNSPFYATCAELQHLPDTRQTDSDIRSETVNLVSSRLISGESTRVPASR